MAATGNYVKADKNISIVPGGGTTIEVPPPLADPPLWPAPAGRPRLETPSPRGEPLGAAGLGLVGAQKDNTRPI